MNQLKKKISNQSHYDTMLLALLPLIFCASAIYSIRVVLVCGTAFITARIVDVAVAVIRKQDIDTKDKSSTVAALTFCMMLPVSVPLYIVIMTVALVVLVGKHVFGGKDAYPFSLAALMMCVAAVNWPDDVFKAVKPFTQVGFWSGTAQSALSSSTQIKSGSMPYIDTLDLLLGNHAGAMGTSFILIIVAIAVYLLSSKRITWHTPVTFIVTCAVFALVFPRIYGVSRLYSLKYEILSSAVIFYAVFMLSEPATTPKTPKAKVVFGVLCGILTMLFRYYGSYATGGCFAILLVNATEGFWDRLFSDNKEEKTAEKTVKDKKTYRKEEPQSKTAQKPKQPKAVKAKETDMDKTSTLDIISRAEDDIDQVEFSTQTIDMEEALRAFDEKYNREGK